MQDDNCAAGCGGLLFAILLVGSSLFLPVGLGVLLTLIVGIVVFVVSVFRQSGSNFLSAMCVISAIEYGIMYLTGREAELDNLAGDGAGMAICAFIMLMAGAAAHNKTESQ